MTQLAFDELLIIGGGHIGTSIAAATTQRGTVKHCRIIEPNSQHRSYIESHKLATNCFSSVDDAAAAGALNTAELIIICTPLSAYHSVAEALKDKIDSTCLVSDVGSTKREPSAVLTRVLPHAERVIPGHPVAGTEHTGPQAYIADLFENRWCILTPAEHANEQFCVRLEAFWQNLGSQTTRMTPQHHDLILGLTSHLPHLVAYALTATAIEAEKNWTHENNSHHKARHAAPMDIEKSTKNVDSARRDITRYAAGGFRDFTRIAGSNPLMWRDVFLHNADSVLSLVEMFETTLSTLKHNLRQGDGAALEKCFENCYTLRESVVRAGQAGLFQPTELTNPTESLHPKSHA